MTRKTLILTIFLLLGCLSLQAQRIKERRVYYLDCSYSMKQTGLWEPVCSDLKRAIDEVADETTELMVIPFAFDNATHQRLNAFSAQATPAGKQKLKDEIDGIVLNKNTKTYHIDPIRDYYENNRVAPNRINYMFLMTDGQNEGYQKEFDEKLQQWGTKYGNENVYGFYVMLDPSAKNPDVEKAIATQAHLWGVETADVNINLIRLQDHAIFNARNENYFDLPYYGDLKGRKINGSFEASAPLKITKVEYVGNHVRFHVQTTTDVHQLPQSATHVMNLTLNSGKKFDFLVTDKVKVKCESKPERSLKVTIR